MFLCFAFYNLPSFPISTSVIFYEILSRLIFKETILDIFWVVVMTSDGGGGRNVPSDHLHRLCVHYIGGAGGDHEAVSSHYR